MPENAEESLKKKLQGITLENSIIGFLDQTACQNIGNSGRIWYKKGNKNILKKKSDKLSVTGIGFQSTNGKSLIDFPEGSKTFDFINFLVKIRIKNSNNPYTKSELNSILNNINIDETHLKTLLESNFHDKTEFKHI